MPSLTTPHAAGLAMNIRGSITCMNSRLSDVCRACALYFGPGMPASSVVTALPDCRATALPLNEGKREVAPTLVVARLTGMAATSDLPSLHSSIRHWLIVHYPGKMASSAASLATCTTCHKVGPALLIFSIQYLKNINI
jgi:hypothetical protein